MSFTFTVSPDFTPDKLSGWYIFNTWLQKQTNLSIHLEMYNSFKSQRDAIKNDSIDLIYANPFDAAMLVREKGFQSLVKAANTSDEAIIAVNSNNAVKTVEELPRAVKIAFTDDPDVYMMGMIMLEPADLNEANTLPFLSDNYVLVAKKLMTGKADIGIFLAEVFDSFSPIIKKQLKILVKSQIDIIHHSLLISPRLIENKELFQKKLLEMNTNEKGIGVLNSLGFSRWEKVDKNEMEFMIDLMDTLKVEDSIISHPSTQAEKALILS